MNEYDVIVIGGGSAGTSAAAAAQDSGARTLLINDGELGGLCILRGCMPTKAMLASAHALHETTRLEPLGIRLQGTARADFEAVMQRKDRQVERFQRAKIRSVEAQGYEVLFGKARFASEGGVIVGERRLSARAYVIATGSRPRRLDIPGLESVPLLFSDDVMRLPSQPRRLLVQGGGPVALELSQFFARIGTDVLLVNRSPLLSRLDQECGEELTRALADEPRLELAAPGRIERLEPRGEGLLAHVRHAEGLRDFEADALLLAVGRRAALEDLGLEHVGLSDAEQGLGYDETMRTAHPSIWVAGDATGIFQVLHLANQEGRVAGQNAAGASPPRRMDYRLKMTVIFTDPPLAHVGETEAEAISRGHDVAVGRAQLPRTGRAITMEVPYGLWKMVADRRSGKLLGSTLVGPRADDLIHLIAVLMRFDAGVDEIFDLPWYHPTLSEAVLDVARDLRTSLAA